MDYGFPIYGDRIKPERKCVGFRFMLGLFLIWLIPMLSDYTSIEELIVWFYFIIIFIIESVLMIFDMKFVSDGL